MWGGCEQHGGARHTRFVKKEVCSRHRASQSEEVAALTKMTEDKLQRQGELSVRIAEMKNDLTDTGDSF